MPPRANHVTRATSPCPARWTASCPTSIIVAVTAEMRRPSNANAVAIVGIGCRFPRAHNRTAFWRLLRDGADAIRSTNHDRFAEGAYDGDQDRALPPYAGLIDDVGGFDAAFFGIAPREAHQIDPQQRL